MDMRELNSNEAEKCFIAFANWNERQEAHELFRYITKKGFTKFQIGSKTNHSPIKEFNFIEIWVNDYLRVYIDEYGSAKSIKEATGSSNYFFEYQRTLTNKKGA